MPRVNVSETAELDFQRLADGVREYIGFQETLAFTNLIEETIKKLGENIPKGNFSLLDKKYHEARAIVNKKRQYKLLYEYDEQLDEITILSIKDARQESFTGFPPIWTVGEK